MNNNWRTVVARRAARTGALLAAVAVAGCGPRVGGPSAYEEAQAAQQKVADSLGGKGMKSKRMHYPQGDAWAVDMTGMTITDDVIRKLKELDHVTEINLSQSTITDEQLGQINDKGIGSLVLKMDLSQTGITDAGLQKMTKFFLLNNLNLVGTKVTPAGVDQFKKERLTLPNVRMRKPTVKLK